MYRQLVEDSSPLFSSLRPRCCVAFALELYACPRVEIQADCLFYFAFFSPSNRPVRMPLLRKSAWRSG